MRTRVADSEYSGEETKRKNKMKMFFAFIFYFIDVPLRDTKTRLDDKTIGRKSKVKKL